MKILNSIIVAGLLLPWQVFASAYDLPKKDLPNKELPNKDFITIAPPSADTCKINFKDLLQEGMLSHPGMGMLDKILAGAEYGIDGAKWGFFPTPSVNISRSADSFEAVFGLSQPLWTGGKLSSAYNMANIEFQLAALAKNQKRLQISQHYLQILSTYLLAEGQDVVLQQNKKQFYDLLAMLGRKMDAGVASQVDKTLLQSKISTLYADLLLSSSKKNIARMQFELLGSRKINCDIVFNYRQQWQPTVTLEHLLDDLLHFHPAIKKQDKHIGHALEGVKAAQAQLYPNLELKAEHRRGELHRQDSNRVDNFVYLSFTLNSGAGLSRLSDINKSRVEVARAEFDRDLKIKELTDQLMLYYTNFITARNQLKLLDLNIITITKVYDSYKRQFFVAKKQWVEVVNVLSQLNNEKIRKANLRVELQILEYKIALLTGRLKFENL